MSIGYSVEGSTDRAFLKGLQQRWLPQAALIEGAFRGTSGTSLRRDIPKICRELSHKGANVFVFLTDANTQNWRQVKHREQEFVPNEFRHLMIYGVAEQNIECWLAADRDYLAAQLNIPPSELAVPDPKSVIEHALGITSYNRKEDEIVLIVAEAPLHNWLKRSPSFESFYADARDLSKQVGNTIPNEREAKLRRTHG